MNGERGIAGVGLDLVMIETIQLAMKRDPDVARSWLTEAEIAEWVESGSILATLAGRVAAKEAVVKALGTGFTDSVAWQDVEIKANATGAPVVVLSGGAMAEASRLQVREVLVSITHVSAVAAATAVAVR